MKTKPTQQELKRENVARQIAREIFTAGNGKRACRVALIDKDGRDLGGWAEKPVRDLVERRLRKFTLFNNSRRK